MQSNKIRKIANHRHLPKYILNKNKRSQDQGASKLRKRVNREANTGQREDIIASKKKLVEHIEVEEEQFPRQSKQGRRRQE